MIILLMGVAGSGKTTVGQLLAGELGWSFADADDFHSAANRAKMAAGRPLDDADRGPWLADLRAYLETCQSRGEDVVLACSALKARYREMLLAGARDTRIVFLTGDPELIRARIVSRESHYMRAGMLESQLATLEPPADALTLDVAAAPAELAATIRRELRL